MFHFFTNFGFSLAKLTLKQNAQLSPKFDKILMKRTIPEEINEKKYATISNVKDQVQLTCGLLCGIDHAMSIKVE
jgi:hypothetical protein